MKIKKFMTLALAISLTGVLASCGGNNANDKEEGKEETKVEEQATDTENKEEADQAEETNEENADQAETETKDDSEAETPEGETVSVTMVTDSGGVNDKSFNQSAYEGLQKSEEEGKASFDYIESHKEDDYVPNLENALDSESDIILTVGFALYKATDAAAEENPEQKYVIIDNKNENNRDNLLGVTFADHQNSFLVGYIAGMQTETNKVGFIGGIEGVVIGRFEYGYRAGVAQAAKEKGEDIEVLVQYANSFDDQAAGKNIADRMYQEGADVVFHAAGGVGVGVIEAAKENNKWVIGVDRDQSEEAPDNMLVSTVKGVGDSVRLIIDEYAKGEFKAGDQEFTLADAEAVTIAYPTTNDLVSKETKEKVEEIRQQLIDGSLKAPENKEQAIEEGWIEEEEEEK